MTEGTSEQVSVSVFFVLSIFVKCVSYSTHSIYNMHYLDQFSSFVETQLYKDELLGLL